MIDGDKMKTYVLIVVFLSLCSSILKLIDGIKEGHEVVIVQGIISSLLYLSSFIIMIGW